MHTTEHSEMEDLGVGSATRAVVIERRGVSREWELLLRLFRANLLKDPVHDPGGKKDFTVRYRRRHTVGNGAVESLDQIAHAGLRVEVCGKKSPYVHGKVRQMLPREEDRWK